LQPDVFGTQAARMPGSAPTRRDWVAAKPRRSGHGNPRAARSPIAGAGVAAVVAALLGTAFARRWLQGTPRTLNLRTDTRWGSRPQLGTFDFQYAIIESRGSGTNTTCSISDDDA
jgi:hypothetical protein